LLFLADTYYPGWKVFVDSKEEEILLANHVYRAVVIPEGDHQILFEYDPDSFNSAKKLALLATLIIIGYVLKETVLKNSKK
jgi:uncharacterized membrane protein YfhO